MSAPTLDVEFTFLDTGNGAGSFVATGKVVPTLLKLLSQGQVKEATRIFECSEASIATDLLEHARLLSPESLMNLRLMLEAARDFSSAGKVLESERRFAEAAKMFERGNDFPSAARSFTQAGDLASAAAAWERAGKIENALEAYRKLGPSEAMAECLVRQHSYWEAALLYQQLGNRRGEVEALKLVPPSSAHRVLAVKRLGDLLETGGHVGPAAQLLADTLQDVHGAQSDAELVATVSRIKSASPGNFVDQAPVYSLDSNEAPATAAAPTTDGYGQLKAIPIFGELALADMKDLFRACEPISYAAGATIIDQGVRGDGLVVILQGAIQVVRVDGASLVTLATLGPNDYVGELSLVDEAPTSARVISQTAVRALVITRQRFAQYLYTHEAAAAQIYRVFTRTLAERLRQANLRS